MSEAGFDRRAILTPKQIDPCPFCAGDARVRETGMYGLDTVYIECTRVGFCRETVTTGLHFSHHVHRRSNSSIPRTSPPHSHLQILRPRAQLRDHQWSRERLKAKFG